MAASSGRAGLNHSSQTVTPEQSLNPVPDISLTAEPILVTADTGAGGGPPEAQIQQVIHVSTVVNSFLTSQIEGAMLFYHVS